MHGLFIFAMKKSNSQNDSNALLIQTRKQLRRFGLSARKGLGQHFLIDGDVLKTIIDAAELESTDTVIEVGPGLGILTAELAKRAGWVIAIELDTKLAVVLKENLPFENIIILNEDVLGINLGEVLQGRAPSFPTEMQPYKVVANLPYYITSPVLRHFLEASVKPEMMLVMVQKEVAEAITAGPGKRSLLSISVQFYGKPSVVAHVPATSFYPKPEVDSAIVKIDIYPEPVVDVSNVDGFFQLVKAGFSASRKQAANSLAQGLKMPKEKVLEMLGKADIEQERRAETFNLEEWAILWRIMDESKEVK